MPRSIGRDPFTAMTTTMQLLNNKRKENRAPSPSDTLCDDTKKKKKKKKKSFGPLVSPHVISQPGKPKRKKHTPSRRRRNTNNNNNNTLTDDIAATSLLLLRTSSTTTTTTFSGGGFGGEEGCGLVFSSLPSLSEGKLGGDGGGGGGGAKDVKVDKTVASPARVMLSTPPQQPKTRMKIRVVLPLLALSAKRRADLGKLYDACELLKRVKAVERMF
jgi:hypothetical protein